MKKSVLMFYLLCKRQLKQPVLVLLLISMPIMGLIFRAIPSMHEGGIPSVALYAQSSNETANAVIEHIISNNDGIHFYRADSVDELESAVIAKDAQCGFIFDDNMKDNILDNKANDSVTLVSNGGDSVTGTVTQIVFSSIMTVLTKDISIKYMEEHDFFNKIRWPLAMEYFNSQFDTIYASGSSLQINFKTLITDSSSEYDTIDMKSQNSTLPVRPLVGVLIFVACILGVHKWLSDRESGVFIPMSRSTVMASRFLYVIVSVLLFSISGVITVVLSGFALSASDEIMLTFLSIVANVIFGVLLTFIIKKSRTIIALLPVLIICSLLICPVFTDIGIYMPLIRLVNKFLPPTYFIGKF